HLTNHGPAKRNAKKRGHPLWRVWPSKGLENTDARSNPDRRKRTMTTRRGGYEREQRRVATCDEHEDRRMIESADSLSRGLRPINAVIESARSKQIGEAQTKNTRCRRRCSWSSAHDERHRRDDRGEERELM